MRFAGLLAASHPGPPRQPPGPGPRPERAQPANSPPPTPGSRRASAPAREIWMFATAFNDRFFTYTFPQRLGGAIDWYAHPARRPAGRSLRGLGRHPRPRLLRPRRSRLPGPLRRPRPTAFPGAPATTRCSPSSGARATATPPATSRTRPSTPRRRTAALDQRQSACDLRFGTSTGALGLRKFPNPRFDAAAWEKIGGWEGYAAILSDDPANPDSRLNRLWDGSVEPPFRIGMACGACHIAYDPLKPPADPRHPAWENIDALVGNQYSRISNLLGSGLSPHRLEWQLIARARPGIVDTSALPMDFVSNPGTMNAIINFARRPLHEDDGPEVAQGLGLRRRRRARGLLVRARARQGKCWERSAQDRDGALGPEGRRGFDRLQRGDPAGLLQHRLLRRAVLGQPSDRPARRRPRAAQLRPDARSTSASAGATAARSAPSRTGSTTSAHFFLTARPTDLWQARGLASPRDLEVAARRRVLRRRGRAGPAGLRRELRPLPFEPAGPDDRTDFTATDPADPTLRLDWLGNDEIAPASEIGTYPGAVAALQPHGRAGSGREYASPTEQARPADPLRPGGDEGRRARLLPQHLAAQRLGARALHAQQRHRPGDLRQAARRRRSTSTPRPTSTPTGKPLADPPACCAFDPSVEGRYALYKASMQELLNPDAADPEDVRARQRHRHRHRAEGRRSSAATSGSA